MHAIIIIPVYDSSFTTQPNFAALRATVNDAISAYSQFSDNISVPITFKLSASVSGAESSFSTSSYSFNSYRTALATRVTSANDAIVLSSIGIGPNDPVLNQPNIAIPEALAFTLGLGPAATNYGTATFNLGDYGPNPGGFLGTIQHEVNEVLGMGSNLPNFTTTATLPNQIAPTDLFRFTLAGARNFTLNAANDPSNKAFFKLSSTGSVIQEWNNLPNMGDYGDWHTGTDRLFAPAPNDQAGDATTFTSMQTSPNRAEYTALDAIGYNLVPEPNSLALLASAALIGGAFRRKRAAQA